MTTAMRTEPAKSSRFCGLRPPDPDGKPGGQGASLNSNPSRAANTSTIPACAQACPGKESKSRGRMPGFSYGCRVSSSCRDRRIHTGHADALLNRINFFQDRL